MDLSNFSHVEPTRKNSKGISDSVSINNQRITFGVSIIRQMSLVKGIKANALINNKTKEAVIIFGEEGVHVTSIGRGARLTNRGVCQALYSLLGENPIAKKADGNILLLSIRSK